LGKRSAANLVHFLDLHRPYAVEGGLTVEDRVRERHAPPRGRRLRVVVHDNAVARPEQVVSHGRADVTDTPDKHDHGGSVLKAGRTSPYTLNIAGGIDQSGSYTSLPAPSPRRSGTSSHSQAHELRCRVEDMPPQGG
jgi:hypothetical protein